MADIVPVKAAPLRGLLLTVLLFGPSAALALDCSKATTAIEKAICGSPALTEQDAALGKAYADALARDKAGAAALKTAQRTWLARRDKACGDAKASQPKLVACLTGLYRSRLLALGAAPAATPGTGAPAPGTPPTPAPVPAEPPAAALPSPPSPPLPSLPAAVPSPAAALDRARVGASGHGEAIVTVATPGRFTLQAKSATGVSLQIVDMISGPGDAAGEPGIKDGRLDLLLDRGTYKLRTLGDPRASGEAELTLEPVRLAGPVEAGLVFGGEAAATLSDGTERAFWVSVPKPGHVSVEAVGRALGDLRLWRNGTDLAPLSPVLDRIALALGHGATRARVEGTVEPGLYLATVYGGPKLAWADSDPAEPFAIRVGDPEPLDGGWVDGTVGPTGTARFRLPDDATVLLLDLPEVAPVTLAVRHDGAVTAAGGIEKASREPVLRLSLGAGRDRVAEVGGAEGQPFRLRALDMSASRRITGGGPVWVGVDAAGEGGDEVPGTVILAARPSGAASWRVIASRAPQVGPGKAWRQRFNFRGTTTLLFEAKASTAVTLGLSGLTLDAALSPVLGSPPPRADGRQPTRWDLEAGWYELRLSSASGAVGPVDVTLGPPGVTAEAQRQPPRPSIPLGVLTLDQDVNYQLFTNTAPQLVLAPRARRLPADLGESALGLYQEAGRALDIPVRVPVSGYPQLRGVNGAAVPVQLTREPPDAGHQILKLHIPAPASGRGLVLSWSDPPRPTAEALIADDGATPEIQAGRPFFFDLARGASVGLVLDVPEGGLYRIETLGRLKTSLRIATPFLPDLDRATANGAGGNALAQTFLRAGRYRVTVTAEDSAGRVGLLARPATLAAGEAVVPDAAARATLADGKGVIFPFDLAEAGRYRLDLYALGDPLRARLEDEAGWPLTPPGVMAAVERRFDPGRYRLVVLPEGVDRRVVARLSPVRPAVPRAGHGPHVLPFEAKTRHQWREPAGATDPREPDRWTFTLAGPAKTTIDVSAGMVAELKREGGTEVLARLLAKHGFDGPLEAGRYVIEARSLGRNDRLDYSVSLATREIQPGAPRRVELPATIAFALAREQVMSLTSFGRRDLVGTVRAADGTVVERLAGRADDWNIGWSRRLPAGSYTLDLAPLDRPRSKDEAAPSEDTPAADAPAESADKPAEEPQAGDAHESGDQPAAAADGEGGSDAGDDAPDGQADAAPPATPDETPPAAEPPKAGTAAPAAAPAAEPVRPDTVETETDTTAVEVRIALPESEDHPILAFGTDTVLTGGPVHVLPLPSAEAGRLIAVAARAGTDVVLALDRATGTGGFVPVGLARGLSPVLAVPADGDSSHALRLSLWTVDGSPARIDVAARLVEPPGSVSDIVRLQPIDFGEAARDIRVGLARTPGAGLVRLAARFDGLFEGSRPGSALQPVTDRMIVPQSETLWLLARGQGPAVLSAAALPLTAGEVSLTLPAGGRATLPGSPPPEGKVRLWTVQSSLGQPALQADRGFGLAPGSAAALDTGATLTVWNAGGEAPLPVRLAAAELDLRPAVTVESERTVVLGARSAEPLRLPPGPKRLRLDLAPGTAAVLGTPGKPLVTVWAGARAQSRLLDTEATDAILLDPAEEARPVHLALAPVAGPALRLDAQHVEKRFFGAAGSLSLPVAAEAGDRLMVAGASARFVGVDGRASAGAPLTLSGPGELVLDHGAGLVAVWIEHGGRSPWPEVKPLDTALPAALTLEGPAMALGLKPPGPVLLHVRTTAPVIATLADGAAKAAPEVFPAGADMHRLLSGGPADLRLYPAQDGPLAGSLDLSSTPVTLVGEGVGEARAVAPGGTALFAFDVRRAGPVGVGIRAEPDAVSVRLLDATGRPLGTGLSQLHRLDPGRYVVEATVPPDATTTLIRPAVVGIDPPPSGPPPEVVQDYLDRAGLAPASATR